MKDYKKFKEIMQFIQAELNAGQGDGMASQAWRVMRGDECIGTVYYGYADFKVGSASPASSSRRASMVVSLAPL